MARSRASRLAPDASEGASGGPGPTHTRVPTHQGQPDLSANGFPKHATGFVPQGPRSRWQLIPCPHALELRRPRRCIGLEPAVERHDAGQSAAARAGTEASSSARAGSGTPDIAWTSASAVEGPIPGSSCRVRKPAMRSFGFCARRRQARTSLTCAASRNFSPPYFTNGMLRRVSSTSSPAEWKALRNNTACCCRSMPPPERPGFRGRYSRPDHCRRAR